MSELNRLSFAWMGAGHSPSPGLLELALWPVAWLPPVCAAAWCAFFVALRGQRLRLLSGLALAGLGVLLAHGCAAQLALPRPFVLGLSPAFVPHGARGSLPSAHATAMFALMFASASVPLRGLAAVLLVGALGMSWARIYLGLHFPIDILAGALLGAGIECSRRAGWRIVQSIASTPHLRGSSRHLSEVCSYLSHEASICRTSPSGSGT